MKICADKLNIVEIEVSQNLWHQRLGHMSEKGLSTLKKKEVITVAKDTALDPCNHCLFGKQHSLFQLLLNKKIRVAQSGTL